MNNQRRIKIVNVVLDLDNTIISAIDKAEAKKMGVDVLAKRQNELKWLDMDGEFKVFERPNLQSFLTWLFANFNVGVWTAASKSYATWIVEKFIVGDKPERKLDFILFSHHCRESKRQCNSQKSLQMFEKFPFDYDSKYTYIIDDHQEVYATQPEFCLRIKCFDVQNKSCVTDNEFERIRRHLETIRLTCENEARL